MNALDITKYGHLDVLESIKDVDESVADRPGVTTNWSIKDTLAHLASYEHLLEDALNSVANHGQPTPYLDIMNSAREKFNDKYVGEYKSMNFQGVVDDYIQTYERVRALVERLGSEKMREIGAIPWYGNEYSLDDFVVYASYGHKREHLGQIKQFKKRLAGAQT